MDQNCVTSTSYNMRPQTIENFLISSDPAIAWKNTGTGHTTIRDPIPPKFVRKWVDFDLATMKKMSGGIFQDALNQHHDFEQCMGQGQHGHFVRKTYDAPSNEKSLDFIFTKTIQDTVSCALSKSQDYLRNKILLPTKTFQMIHGCESENLGDKMTYEPDWAGIYCSNTTNDDRNFKDSQDVLGDKEWEKYAPSLPSNCLPGDSKLRHKVNGQALPSGQERLEDIKHAGLVHALTQISTYCFHSGSRYGYILSETQLIVVRVRPGSQARSQYPGRIMDGLEHDGILEYRLIGYHPHNRGRTPVLSVNLALWWLHLLAVIDNRIDWRYQPLAEMEVDSICQGSLPYQRSFSKEYSPLPQSQFQDPQPVERRRPPPRSEMKRRRSTKGLSGPQSKSESRRIVEEEDDDLRTIPTPPSSTGKLSRDRTVTPPSRREIYQEPSMLHVASTGPKPTAKPAKPKGRLW